MWNLLARYRLARAGARRDAITQSDVLAARSVLFAVFSRYGDGIAAFKGIGEFARRYPDKRYTVVTTPQALPYAEEIIGARTTLIGIDKRRDFLKIARLLLELRRAPPDIAFNPWSHGSESQALLSFARRFELFTDFAKTHAWHNHYQWMRDCLRIPPPVDGRTPALPKTAGRVVISPFSTDIRRSLSAADIERLLGWARARYPGCEITLALFRAELPRLPKVPDVRHFFFAKSDAKSREFLRLVKEADLFIGVDSGPLHVAGALGRPALGLFGPTPPERVLDRDTTIVAVRLPELAGVLCDIRTCGNPVCLHGIDLDAHSGSARGTRYAVPVKVEVERCRVGLQQADRSRAGMPGTI